jgi:alpha-tubulin suppressor-like RCC1 family protein
MIIGLFKYSISIYVKKLFKHGQVGSDSNLWISRRIVNMLIPGMKRVIKYTVPIILIEMLLFLSIPAASASAFSCTPMISAGGYGTLGLNSNGTIVTTFGGEIRQELNSWTNIKQIAAGNELIGLHSDGTAVTLYNNPDVHSWTDIIQVCSGGYHVAGLKSNGAVVVAGNTADGQGETKGWTHIVQLAAGASYTIGLKDDGTVVARRMLRCRFMA